MRQDTAKLYNERWEWFDKCHPEVREALCYALIPYDAKEIFEYQERRGVKATIKKIREWDLVIAQRSWMRVPFKKSIPSSYVSLGVSPLNDFTSPVRSRR